jgi:NAD(P)-dependent dehydrogenase (short-subunit alcohol dehydrogenase family)
LKSSANEESLGLVMSLYTRLLPKGPSGFGAGSTAEEVTEGISLEGKTVFLTGCNSGLGLETARVLLMRGAHVVGTTRTKDKAEAAARSFARSVRGHFTSLVCELSDLGSVRACIREVRERALSLDALIANAGIMALSERQMVHGCEAQLFTNHVGHFLLITELLPQLGERGRVVLVTSEAHRLAPSGPVELRGDGGPYSPWRAYGRSKLANLLFAKALARRFQGTPRTAHAVHPGAIKTNLGRHVKSPLVHGAFAAAGMLVLKSIPEGAATQCLAAVHPVAEGVSGAYWANCNVDRPSPSADDVALSESLWQATEQFLRSVP